MTTYFYHLWLWDEHDDDPDDDEWDNRYSVLRSKLDDALRGIPHELSFEDSYNG